MLEVDGRVYAGPGKGITTAGTSTLAGMTSNQIRGNTRQIALAVLQADGPFQEAMRSVGVDEPECHLALNTKGNQGVHEQKRAEEHTYELQLLMRSTYAVVFWKKEHTSHYTRIGVEWIRWNDSAGSYY